MGMVFFGTNRALGIVTILAACQALHLGCSVGKQRGPGEPGTESSLSSISLGLPDRGTMSGDVQAKLDGFHVILEPLPAGCNGAQAIDISQAWANSTTTHKILQGCDWSVGVELGKFDGTKLSAVYFSNWAGAGQGEILRKEAFQGKPAVSMGVVLKITAAGIAAGLAGTVTGSGNTDLVVDVVVTPPGGGTGTVTGTATGTGTGVATDYDWRADATMVDVPAASWSGEDGGSAFFRDVMGHTTDRFTSSTLTTNAHETMHGLTNSMRNASGESDQFIYFENGKGFYVLEPQLNSNRIREYVPAGAKTLAQSRFQLYLIQQTASWTNGLMVFDEWRAYTTNGRVALEIHAAGKWRDGGTDEVDGAVDFLYFASALVQALKVNEPQYLQTNKAFKAAFAYVAEDSVKNAEAGLKISEFNGFHARELLEHFRTSPENESIRTTLKELYGAAWCQRVLGF